MGSQPRRVLAGPSGIAAGFAKFVFHIAELLFQRFQLFLFGVDLGGFVVDVRAAVLLLHGLLRIVVILDLIFVQFALQDVDFLFGAADFVALFLETLRQTAQPKSLAAFADRWKKDPRPWARKLIFDYLPLSDKHLQRRRAGGRRSNLGSKRG